MACPMPESGIPATVVDGRVVAAGEGGAAVVAGVFHVDALVLGGGVAVVHPEKGADLHARARRHPGFNALGGHADDFAGAEKALGFEAEVGKGAGLRADRPGAVAPADGERRAAQTVPRRVNPFLGQHQQRAGPLDGLLGVADAVLEILLLADEGCHHLGRVDGTAGGVGKIAPPVEGALHQGIDVVDLAHGDDAERAEVRAHEERLRVGVADDPDAVAPVEAGQIGLELGAEIAVLDVVDGALDAFAIAHRQPP